MSTGLIKNLRAPNYTPPLPLISPDGQGTANPEAQAAGPSGGLRSLLALLNTLVRELLSLPGHWASPQDSAKPTRRAPARQKPQSCMIQRLRWIPCGILFIRSKSLGPGHTLREIIQGNECPGPGVMGNRKLSATVMQY